MGLPRLTIIEEDDGQGGTTEMVHLQPRNNPLGLMWNADSPLTREQIVGSFPPDSNVAENVALMIDFIEDNGKTIEEVARLPRPHPFRNRMRDVVHHRRRWEDGP